jgi:omega-6 fatty acid desaturase (delta-12 desaturase)
MSNSINQPSWREVIVKYAQPNLRSSLWQLTNTLIPYLGLLFLMYLSLKVSYFLTLLLSVFAAGFMVRLFIIFHDCGHGSFFKSTKLSDVVGIILGILTFTPYYKWHRAHKIHHATVGNLDKRGTGDVWVLTVDEFNTVKRWKRRFYRVYRNPLIMFMIGSPLIFLGLNRLTNRHLNKKEKLNVYFTNFVLLLMLVLMHFTIGIKAYLMIQLPVIFIGSVMGVWLFYVQHQFEGVHWYRQDEWDYKTVALQGSSFYKLPKVLQWFSGNIGFHHIHHLSPKIPNYKLAKCHKENTLFSEISPITLWTSIRTMKLRLWNERSRKLISFRELQAGI